MQGMCLTSLFVGVRLNPLCTYILLRIVNPLLHLILRSGGPEIIAIKARKRKKENEKDAYQRNQSN